MLVGESAHRCHPVGGQGLNLCWRDVAVLHRLALRAARAGCGPAASGRLRHAAAGPICSLTLLATDLLVRLYSTRLPCCCRRAAWPCGPAALRACSRRLAAVAA